METNSETRKIIQKIINKMPNASHFQHLKELLNKIRLVDSLQEELPNNSAKYKKIKI